VEQDDDPEESTARFLETARKSFHKTKMQSTTLKAQIAEEIKAVKVVFYFFYLFISGSVYFKS